MKLIFCLCARNITIISNIACCRKWQNIPQSHNCRLPSSCCWLWGGCSCTPSRAWSQRSSSRSWTCRWRTSRRRDSGRRTIGRSLSWRSGTPGGANIFQCVLWVSRYLFATVVCGGDEGDQSESRVIATLRLCIAVPGLMNRWGIFGRRSYQACPAPRGTRGWCCAAPPPPPPSAPPPPRPSPWPRPRGRMRWRRNPRVAPAARGGGPSCTGWRTAARPSLTNTQYI